MSTLALRLKILAAGLALAGAARLPATEPAPPAALVLVHGGTLPIVISAPHGGDAEIPGASPRKSGVTVQDSRTLELARELAAALETRLGAAPSLVAARFHRKYLDVNRSPREAYEGPAARAVYEQYHQALREQVGAVRTRGRGRGLLLDVHGQQGDPDTLHRGTQNGRSVSDLLQREGWMPLVGPQGLLGSLSRLGYMVFPLSIGREHDSYDGGFIVGAYGSQNRDGIDAVQLEVGRDLRIDAARRAKLSADLSESVATFYRRYLSQR